MIYIYGLVDPRTREICYIGKTNNTKKRLRQHLGRSRVVAVREWVNDLQVHGFNPLMIILEKVEDENKVKPCEQWWISHGLRLGWPLINTITSFSLVSNQEGSGAKRGSAIEMFGDEMAEIVRRLYLEEGYSKNRIINEVLPPASRNKCFEYINAALSRQEVSA